MINAQSEICKARFRHEINATTTLRAVLTPDRRKWRSSSGRLQSSGSATPVDPPPMPFRQRLQSERASSYTDSDAGTMLETVVDGPQTPSAPSDSATAAQSKEGTLPSLSPVPPDISRLWLTSMEYDSQDEESELPPLERSIGHIKSLHLLQDVVHRKAQKLRAGRGNGHPHGSGRKEHRRLASEPAKKPSRLRDTQAEDSDEHQFDEVRRGEGRI